MAGRGLDIILRGNAKFMVKLKLHEMLMPSNLSTVAWSVHRTSSAEPGPRDSHNACIVGHCMETKYPLVLRLWWGAFFLFSCYCLVVDFLSYKKYHPLSVYQFWASDIASLIMGFILSCIGYLGKKNDEITALQEPLLIAGDAFGISKSTVKAEETVTPYANAGIFSLITFSWLSPLIALAKNKKTLNLEDVPQLASCDSVREVFPILNNKLETYSRQSNNKVTAMMLAKALLITTWREVALCGCLQLVHTVASYAGPYFIDNFVQYLSGHHTYNNEGYVLATIFFVSKLFECLALRHWIFKVQQTAYRVKAALVAKIYNKGLKISNKSKKDHAFGEIINLISADAETICNVGWVMHEPWMFVVQVALALVILYKDLGLAFVAALVSTFLVMLANFPVGWLEEKYQEGLMKSKDARTKTTFEVLRNMRILKLQAWELRFLNKIFQLRNIETEWLKKYLYTRALGSFVFSAAPIFVSVVTFGTCMLLGNPLTSGKILSAIATFKILQEPIVNLPDVISTMVQSKECIMGLLNSKTVVYVTHQMDFLPSADLILVMKDGEIKQAGKYNDILKLGSDFMELVGAHEEALQAFDSVDGKERSSMDANTKQDSLKDIIDEGDQDAGTLEQLVQEEERETGSVTLSVYWKYLTTAYGGLLVPILLLAQIFVEILQIGSNYWIAWATPVSKDLTPRVDGSKLILVYVALCVGSSICLLAKSLPVLAIGYTTAKIFFNNMHRCIFQAPMSFFDATPSGRILSRASTDQSTLDKAMSNLLSIFSSTIIQLSGVIIVISQVAWPVILIFIPLTALCIWLQRYYIVSSRELTRLCGVCEAPVIQHFSETISGSTMIRCFNQEPRFRDLNMRLIDANTRPNFNVACAMQWLCLRSDLLTLATYAFLLVFVILIPKGTIDPSIAGLAVTYGLSLNSLQQWLVWNLCIIENRIISVERILQYTSIPSEPPLVVESNRPDSHWPTQGEVSINELQVRYAPHLPLVLRGLTCTFLGAKRTGIVGRTGSGKSTLIQALFRIVEPAAGQISIDGVNILSIGLHDLRSRLSIIPQDPTMFEGTIRSNLDPLEEHTDEQIWEALDKCQLGDEVRNKPEKLYSQVSENGENWSVGERQLVCLGRVLLKKSKVLVLDEATASVDTATDNLIQQTLKQHFRDSTVITIAHRITSVIESDMVLVLADGLLAEYDTPDKLLADKTSLFSKLVAEYTMRSSSSF
ncbi:ABC transporter C family member 3 [Striga hermonthica]|uniref:ABC-type xenobiotic transporter n=1 Tax=Striga hermonthica TaxID=68872 RepID=A0A9N7NYS6_STRHE|nr:ABC transporter C family member 3 [Striga hermonthica]